MRLLRLLFSFEGRLNRSTYVKVIIPLLLGQLALTILLVQYGEANSTITAALLVIVVCKLAAMVRRLRDIRYSPWWSTLVFIPMVGVLVMLLLGVPKSK